MGESNPFLIPPPPGGFPKRTDDTPPPGESATHKAPVGRGPVSFTPTPAPGAFPAPSAFPTPPVSPPAAPAPAAPAAAPAPPVPTDSVVDETVVRPTGTSRPEQAPAPAGVGVVLHDGSRIPLLGALVLGRRPTAPDSASAARAIPLQDPSKTVSKTHALLEAGPSGVRVTDLGSTNGVMIVRPGFPNQVLRPDVATPAVAGDRIHLGDYVLSLVAS